MPEVVVDMKTQQVGMKQALYDLLPPRQSPINLGRRKRRVAKPSYVAVGLGISQHFRHHHQVVVMDPNIVIVLVHLKNRCRKNRIRFFVRFELASTTLVHTFIERRHNVMEKRPENVIGESVVVLIDEVVGQKHRIAILVHRLSGQEVFVLRCYLDARPSQPHHVEVILDAGET